MLHQITKLYVEKQIEEAKGKFNATNEDYYIGYFQALYDGLASSGYNFEQINTKIKAYQEELNLKSYIS